MKSNQKNNNYSQTRKQPNNNILTAKDGTSIFNNSISNKIFPIYFANKETKQLLAEPEVTTRGFIYVKDSAEMIAEIKRISEAIIDRNIMENYIEFNKE